MSKRHTEMGMQHVAERLAEAEARIAILEAENANQKQVIDLFAESADMPVDAQTLVLVRCWIANCRTIEDLDQRVMDEIGERRDD
jgi:acyl-coenzyme A synthetase/AMP-(fatty) acid ligase